MTADGPRIAAWGFFGIGNLGNEASLAALLSHLRTAHPTADVCVWAARADTVPAEHGVPARQLMTFRSDSRPSRAWTPVLKGASRLWDVPRTWRMVGGVDVVVVPGTGVLESGLMASPWGMPYWLFLVALAGRLRGRPVVLVSVGAEPAAHPVTRWLDRSTVRLARSCSFRDEASREALGPAGARGEVVPDIAFALPVPETVATPVATPGRRAVVGVMAYDGRTDDPDRGAPVRRAYLDRMTELVTRLADAGRTVTLVVGDRHDEPVAVELEERVRRARPDLDPGTVRVSPARTFEAVMAEMAGVDVVVASRYHSLVAALKVAAPVVSLGYAPKNAHLLAWFGLGHRDQPVDDFDVDRVVAQVAEATSGRDPARVAPVLERLERRVDAELHRLPLQRPAAGRHARRPGRAPVAVPGRSAGG